MCELKTNNCFQCSRWNNNDYAVCMHLDGFNRKDAMVATMPGKRSRSIISIVLNTVHGSPIASQLYFL